MIDHCQCFGIDLILNLVIPFRVWIMSFYLQVFFICSGITSFKRYENEYTKDYYVKFIVKRFIQIIIPYLIWGLIYAPNINWNVLMNLFIGTNVSIEAVGINGVLWFLPVMFISSLIFEFLLITCKKICNSNGKTFHIYYIGFTILCMISSNIFSKNSIDLIWGTDIALTGVVLMVIGSYLKPLSVKVVNLKKRYVSLFLLLIPITFLLSQINMPHVIENNKITYSYVVWMARGYYGKSYSLFLVISVLNFMWLIAVGIFLQGIKKIVFLGKHTMILMVTHPIIFGNIAGPVHEILKKILGSVIYGEKYVIYFSIVLCLITVLFQYPICKFIEKFAPNLEGRQN